MPLSATFLLYHGNQFKWWKKPEIATDYGQATGKLYHLRLWVECTLFVIYKAGHEPTPYWWWACMSYWVIQLPNSLSHPSPVSDKSFYSGILISSFFYFRNQSYVHSLIFIYNVQSCKYVSWGQMSKLTNWWQTG